MNDDSHNTVVIDIGYTPPDLKQVLVVDDEAALQALIHDVLEGEYRLSSAYNGRQGIEMAANLQPDVILMDVMMPDMDGYEAIKMLNANGRTRRIPVIVMTARNFDDSTVQEIKKEVNVVAFLNKPFGPKILRETIKLALERNKPVL